MNHCDAFFNFFFQILELLNRTSNLEPEQRSSRRINKILEIPKIRNSNKMFLFPNSV